MRGGGQGRSCHCQGEVPPQLSDGKVPSAKRGWGDYPVPFPSPPAGHRGAPRAAASAPGSAGRGGHSPEVLPIVLIAGRPQLRVVVVGRGRRSSGGSRGKAGSRAEPGRRGAEGASSPHRRRHLRCCLLLPPLPRRLPGTRSGRRRRGAGGDPDVGGAGPGRGSGAAASPSHSSRSRRGTERFSARLPSALLPARGVAVGRGLRCAAGSPGSPSPAGSSSHPGEVSAAQGQDVPFWGGQGGRSLQ